MVQFDVMMKCIVMLSHVHQLPSLLTAEVNKELQ